MVRRGKGEREIFCFVIFYPFLLYPFSSYSSFGHLKKFFTRFKYSISRLNLTKRQKIAIMKSIKN